MKRSFLGAVLFLLFSALYVDSVSSADKSGAFKGKTDGNAIVSLDKAADDYRNEGKIEYAGGFTLKQLIMQTCATKDTAMKAYQKVLKYYDTLSLDDMKKWARNAALGQSFKFYPNFFPAEGGREGEKGIAVKELVPFFEDSELSKIETLDNPDQEKPAQKKLRGDGDEPSTTDLWNQNTINPAGGAAAGAAPGAAKVVIDKFLTECKERDVTAEMAAKGVKAIIKKAGLSGAQQYLLKQLYTDADSYTQTAVGYE